MFKSNALVQILGAFKVVSVTDEYVSMDSFEKGLEEPTEAYEEGLKEVNPDGSVKDFDGFQEGDFFKINGAFAIVDSNEVFSKVMVDGIKLSFPNHKLMEV